MENSQSQLNIICLESEAFYSLIEEVVVRINQDSAKREDRWIDDKETMRLLNIKSKTTLQKFRDQGVIRFSQIGKKVILYDRESIMTFIDSKAKNMF